VTVEAAVQRARTFLEDVGADEHLVVYADFDADGLAAAAVLVRGLRALGRPAPTVHLKSRAAPAWSAPSRAAVAALQPDKLVMTDLGMQDSSLLPEVPTLFVDHHVPSGTPGSPHVAAVPYDARPTPCSAWLAYEVVRPWLAPDDPALWVAGVGVLSDLGDKAPWPHMRELRRRFKITHVREAKTLCNMARRAAVPLPEVPLAVLCEAPDPRAMDRGEAGEALRAARAQVRGAMGVARRQRPLFANEGPWAMVPVDSRCQVHPLIATQWAGRLPKHVVLAPNPGLLPDAVAFSIRTRRRDVNLPELLRALPMAAEHPDTFGHGHPGASGGQLPAEAMARFLEAVGLPPLPS